MPQSLKLLIVLVISCFGLQSWAQQTQLLVRPTVDERVELLSILFRLAECKEYSSRMFPGYVDSIEQHFGPFRDHEAVKYIKNTLRPNGIGYDAVMMMAISISESYPFAPLIPFSKDIPEARWGKKRASAFLTLLNDFYEVTHCQDFFEANESLYTTASQNFLQVYEALDIQWYADFYGEKPKGELRIVNALGNGGANYGPKITIDGKEIAYAIMGTWTIDSSGMPIYQKEDYFPVLLHEFNHSFVNHLVYANRAELARSGKRIYQPMEGRMRALAYGTWEVMIAESIVRAAVIKYLKDHNYHQDLIDSRLINEINIGFLWTGELVEELDRFDQNRTAFPTLESFMPELIKFFEKTAENIQSIEESVDKRRPQIVSIGPFENGNQQVDYSVESIEIAFNQKMKGNEFSISPVVNGKNAFPTIGEVHLSEDKKTLFISLRLEPNTRYQFLLSGRNFVSEEGFGISDYEVNFKTKKE